MAKTRAPEVWAERVRAWRESGQTAATFAEGKGFEASTLRFWSSRLNRTEVGPRIVQLVPKTASEASPPSPRDAALLVEVGSARIRLERGFDEELLRQVVRTLGGPR